MTMRYNSNDWLLSYFSSGASEVVQPGTTQIATVLYMPVSPDPLVAEKCSTVLSKHELDRADRFAADFDRMHFMQRRGFRRYCAANAIKSSQTLQTMVFEQTEYGRPFITCSPEIWFSFSSCRSGFLGAWSSTHAVGVDLENPTKKLEAIELANRFFAAEEAETVKETNSHERLGLFYKLWTLKEAALKSIGQGLPYGLDAFKFAFDPTLQIIDVPAEFGGRANFSAFSIEEEPLCAAIVLRKLC